MATGLRTKTVADSDWILEFCNFREAWALPVPRGGGTRLGEGITVVHLDTGYTRHPELLQDDRYLISSARNFAEVSGLPKDPSLLHLLPAEDDLRGSSASHGTKTASVLMSGEGPPTAVDPLEYSAVHSVSGVAPMVRVIPYRVTDWVNLTDTTAIALATALYYAISHLDPGSVGVVSVSLGRSSFSGIERESHITKALKEARNRGVVVCAAAGQLQIDSPRGDTLAKAIHPAFPARDPNTLCVSGCKPDHTPIRSAFLGREVDITAPAYDLWVARTNRGTPKYDVYQSWGTSYATAIVSGACALWQAYHGRTWLLDPANYGPELIFALFKEVLRRSSHKPAAWDETRQGAGVLDANALLLEPLPPKSEIESLNRLNE